MQFFSRRVGLEGLERRSCGLHLRVKLTDRTQRLAQFLAQARSRLSQHAQHLFFALRFDLLASQHVARLCIESFDRNDVVATKRGN